MRLALSSCKPLRAGRMPSSPSSSHPTSLATPVSARTSISSRSLATSGSRVPAADGPITNRMPDVDMDPSSSEPTFNQGSCLDTLLAHMGEVLPFDSNEELQQSEGMLHSMYGFKHLQAATDQSAPGRYIKLLENFVMVLEQQVPQQIPKSGSSGPPLGQGIWPCLSPGNFKALSAAVDVVNSKYVTWFPKFGCALLALPSPAAGDLPYGLSVRLEELSLYLVALDAWEHHIHSSPGHIEHSTETNSHKLVVSGSVPSAAYDDFVNKIINTIEQRRNSSQKVGFQHTPAFIRAVVRDVAASVAAGAGVSSGMTYPKGGFTDVGQHTGSTPRNTSWPLVTQTLLAVLATSDACSMCLDPELLFKQTLVHMNLWLLLGLVKHISAETADSTMINKTMVVLQALAVGAAALAADKHDVGALPAIAESIQQQLQAAVMQRQRTAAQKLVLPASDTCNKLLGKWVAPTGVLPAEVTVSSSAEGLEAARLRAARNLGSLPVVKAGQSLETAARELSQLLQQGKINGDDVKLQHALRSVEEELYSRAVVGISGSQEYAALSSSTVDQLWNLVDLYRECLVVFKSSAAGAAHLQMDMRSRELLVVWVTYCITFEAGRHQHTLLQQYGVALQFEDLRHLTLSDRAATDAALAIGSYLKQHTVAERPVFSLRDSGAATFELAGLYASHDSGMCSIYDRERSTARVRVQQHWEQVKRQQRQARRLRDELRELREQERKYKSQYDACRDGLSDEVDRNYYYRRLNNVRSQISTTQSDLSRAEKPPAPVVQPLPENRSRAMQWLFFLYMSPMLRQLSRGSFLAQQLLLPLPLSHYSAVQQLIRVANCRTSLTEHYNSANRDSTWSSGPYGHTGSQGRVMLYSGATVPSRSIMGPSHIDSYTSDSVGVWYPDDLTPIMAWQGSGCSADSNVGLSSCSFFDPFTPVPEATVLDSCTEKLAYEYRIMQWAMQQPYSRGNVAANRGNLAIAQQDQSSKPACLSKHAYLKLAGLRSYPLRQLHRLATLLCECRDMPLDSPGVRVMLLQTLYHLGPLVAGAARKGASSSGLRQEWRTQWEVPGGVLDALCAELQKLADELADKPRAHDAVLLLGEIAAYLSDWHAPCKAVARRFAEMTSAQADVHLQAEVAKAATASDEKAHTEMLAKQCRARMMALLCYAAGPLDAGDVQHMIKLMLLIKHGDVYLGQVVGLQQQQAQLRVLCHNVLCRRLQDIHSQVTDSHLTAAATSVLHTVPTDLSWQAVGGSTGGSTASYEAIGSDDQGCQHLYSVNILDGTLLADGYPPSRLPREVTEHPLYLRTFGRVDFEVFKTEQGVLVTDRAVNGRHYEFILSAKGHAGSSADELMIVEVDDQAHGERLQLLDAGEGHRCAGWGEQLPVRLRELHSHWLSREHGAIILRPTKFLEHSTQYLIRAAAADAPPPADKVAYCCWHVPSHLQAQHWLQLFRQQPSELVQQHLVVQDHASHLLQVLGKFENRSYIHTYQSTSQHQDTSDISAGQSSLLMLFELPRFGLKFQLRSDGVLASKDFKGYCLHESQQLVSQAANGSTRHTLADFQQYLVLQRSPELSTGAVPGSGRSDVLVLVPAGQVQPMWSAARKVTVMTDTSTDAKLKFHTYELHGRFQYLQASSIESRLQLAALYAATSSMLPEPVSEQTGVETAMQLVRHSWTDQPLEPMEAAHLRSVSAIGGHLAPALRVLAYEMEASSRQLQHLLVHNATVGGAAACPALDSDAAAEYQQLASSVLPGGWGVPVKQLLTPHEEQRALHAGCRGISRSCNSTPRWLREYGTLLLDVPSSPVKAEYIPKTEGSLKRLVLKPASASVPPYPLKYDEHDAVPLRKEMHKELEESWRDHHSSPEPTELMPGAKELLMKLQPEVQHRRQQSEDHVMNILSHVPVKQTGEAGACFNLMRSSNASPKLGARDLLECMYQRQLIQEFNPFLSEASRAAVHDSILIWAQLCVLEDKLERLVKLCAAGEDMYKAVIIRELLVERIWAAAQHPKWLVFEVEGQLQIRPDQFHHAKELLAHTKDSSEPGPITQLNMGEGKTRVILPMLALEWADQSCVMRLNFLSPLLSMSHQHLHNTLTASVLNVRLFTMPFHRDVQVNEQGAHAMLGALASCKQSGGVLLVAPEHRLSLQLKAIELWGRGEHSLFCKVQELLTLPYQDILDESDELLHHRYQLVYACGTPQPLPALQERCIAVQALLRLLSDMADTETSPELTQEGVATWTPSTNRPPGSFCGLQLLSGPALESVASGLWGRLAEELIRDPPYDMRWLASLGEAKGEFLSCVTDPAASAHQILEEAESLLSQVIHNQQDLEDQVLVIRGLLACDLLKHALLNRHRVNYGVSRLPTARKRLAVPFRAADTPSPRSEFAQPDVALILTHLSYYYDGLTLEEFKEALLKLLQMGPTAQDHFYSRWLQLSQLRMAPDHKTAFDDVRKIDPTNSQQLQLMHSYMSHNMAVVNFWLSYCVLPTETVQYPKRLVATSWNLADNPDGRIVGFSGTNDNHRLLPLQVRQRFLHDHPHLAGTNGKMIAWSLTLAEYRTLHRPVAAQQAKYKPDWQLLLDAAMQQKGSAGRTGVEALLDCGALLAGVETRDAAHYILQHMPGGRYQGVCYYEPKYKQWTVADSLGRITPLHQSPVAEADCFVIYDDARCRGADLKLNQQAVGLLTLAPGMCKDKMMQAAGRMRQLGRGQKLLVLGLQDVTNKIHEATAAAGNSSPRHLEPGMRDVLQWVMDNTVQSTQHGVLEHATQGMLFAVTKGVPDQALLDEKMLLADFYGTSKAREPAIGVLQAAANKSRLQLQQSSNGASAASNAVVAGNERLSMAAADREALIQKILTVGTAHGEGYSVVAGQGADEECERELEKEEEEEKEEEKEVPRVTAAAETDWNYSAAFAAASVAELVQGVRFQVLSLPDVAQQLGPGFRDFDWSAKVFCTSNFRNTIQQAAMTAGDGVGPYQRYLDAILVFANGDVLLLSEREAEGLQETVWARTATCTSCSEAPALLSLCYAQQVMQHGPSTPLLLATPLEQMQSSKSSWFGRQPSWATPEQSARRLLRQLGQTEAVHMHFFNGGASQYSVEQQLLLHQLVQGKREEAKDVLFMRDLLTRFARSELELACDY